MGNINKLSLKSLDAKIFRLAMRSSTADNSQDYQEMKELLKEVRIAFNEIDNCGNETDRIRDIIMGDCYTR